MATPRSASLNNERPESIRPNGRDAAGGEYEAGGQYEVSSVRKALEVLCAFTPHTPTWTLSALSRSLRIPKSTLHNLMRTLESFGCISQNSHDKRYTLGPKIHELSLVFSSTSELLSKAMPALRRLATQTKETVKLGVLSEGRVLVVGAIESSHQLHTRGDVGGRWPLHSTSLGKAMLSALAPVEVRQLLGRRRLQALTPKTITTIERLEVVLAGIRDAGYALDWEENEPGVHCVAAPIRARDQLAGALSISGPAVRIPKESVNMYAAHVMQAAKDISQALGMPERRAASTGT